MKNQKVFINRTLNMKRIKYIGLDMDHTLIRYNSAAFEGLAHRIMLEKLVKLLDYPKAVLNLKFDYDLAIRGLVVDKDSGNLLKLSRFGAIRGSYHGLHPIDYKTQRKLYRSTYIDLSDPSYDTIDTAFSISIATLFAQLVDLKDNSDSVHLPEYTKMYADLTFVLDQAHRDGSLKDVVRDNLPDYIIKSEETVAGLERFKKHDKKIFIVTNSDFEYSKLLLEYAIDPFLKNDSSWHELFEFVVTSARKPRFFYDDLNFLKIDPETGAMTNLQGKIEPGVYQGGCANRFTDSLELNPDEILYVGDHIYGDIVRLKKDCAWRTALVVEELEHEVQKLEEAKSITANIDSLMNQKIPLESRVDELVSNKIEKENSGNQKEVDDLLGQISDIDKQISPLIKSRQAVFNPHWGEVMRVGIEESYFAYQMERFACIYMANLADLLEMSPRTYFRSSSRPMPHDPQ